MIASTLKPIDDVRGYEKLSLSMAKTNKYVVNIIGNRGKKEDHKTNISQHPHFIRRHQWLKRWLLPIQILNKSLKLNPELFIITTHELLLIAIIGKWIKGWKIIYDIQENYALNIQKLNTHPLKTVAASYVRLKERLTSLFIDHFWLAEACYEKELPFLKKSTYTVLENKAKATMLNRKESKHTLLFTGTISEYSGVQHALTVYYKLKEITSDISLHIVGQVHDQKLWQSLKAQAHSDLSIKLTLSEDTIPHTVILEAIHESGFGIIGYTENEVNKDKIPTKLYEYSRYQLPFLIQKGTKWYTLGEQIGGAIDADFEAIDASELLKRMDESSLFPQKEYPIALTWEEESRKLIASIKKSINNI